MISDWMASQNPYVVALYASGYGLLAAAMPETMATMQNMLDAAGATMPEQPIFDLITSIIKTVLTILVMLSLFVLQTLKACEQAIKMIKNWRRKPEQDKKEGEK